MREEVLLREITKIKTKYDFLEKNTAAKFNIFDILDVSSDEVRICRALYAILNPKGTHGRGAAYLKSFVEQVLQLNESENESWENANVFREYMLPSGRRVDLVIQTSKRFIPIEVKIYAGDQYLQCYDYYKYARQHDQNACVYYLTLDGHVPSGESCKGLSSQKTSSGEIYGYEGVQCISFASDILSWLRSCLQMEETIRIETLRAVFMQFIEVLETLTQQPSGGRDMEIAELLTSKENMKAAWNIYKNFDEIRVNLMQKVLKALEKKIEVESGKSKNAETQYDYESSNEVLLQKYYKLQSSTYPGISYYCKNLYDDVDLYFRIEIDHNIFFGFCTPKNKKEAGVQMKELQRVEFFGDALHYGWWAMWEYLPNGNKEDSANFKVHNDNYFRLFDEKYFDEFIEKCYQRMKETTNRFAEKTGFQLL